MPRWTKLLLASAFLLPAPAMAADAPALKLADKIAIWKAAGFLVQGGKAIDSCEQPKTPSIELQDLNNDGRKEAIVTDGGSCYGMTGAYFAILTPQGPGKWRVLLNMIGIPTVMKSRAKGWPDIEIGGPGFCFPIWRYNGTTYVHHRNAYEGKPCKPAY